MGNDSPITVRTDLFEMDHLFGCWIRALPDLEEYVEETGERVPPEEIDGWIFLDESTMVELRFDGPVEGGAYVPVAAFYTYRLDDGGELVAAPRIAGDDDDDQDGDYSHGEAFALGWFIGSDGLLYLKDDEDFSRYSPVDIKTLVDWGFDGNVIAQIVDHATSQDMTFIETFNEEDADRLKARYWEKVERGER